MLVAQPVAAQGIFQSLFGGLVRHEAPPPPVAAPAYVEPGVSMPRAAAPAPAPTRAVASGVAFCVRSCDGHFFPVRATPGMSAAEACHSFCPASETKLYHGASIDGSVGPDGKSYRQLPNAFAYRKQLVAGCTCNGRSAFGLAHVDATRDPTLRPGDVVATDHGLMAYTGGKGANAAFTPAKDYQQFSKDYRAQLSQMQVAQPTPGAPGEFTAAAASSDGNLRSAQLSTGQVAR